MLAITMTVIFPLLTS